MDGLHGMNGSAAGIVDSDRYTPASFLAQELSGDVDPASKIPGMAANFGDLLVPHVQTFQSIIGNHAKVYRDCDEATKNSLDNARFMRNDCGVMECVEARQRCVALLDWSLVPEDEKSHEQKELCDELKKILERVRLFPEWRYTLMHAIWYGKYAINNRFRWDNVCGQQRQLPVPKTDDDYGWQAINGDKLVFRFDDGNLPAGAYANQLGIRINAAYRPGDMVAGRYRAEAFQSKIGATDRGMAYFLDKHQRKMLTVHRHVIEDAPFEDALSAGSIHGVGIRSRIYWEWIQKQETLAFLMEYLERSAGGIEVWTYPMGNAAAKAATETAAKNRQGGARNSIIVPKPLGVEGEQYGVQIIEPGMGGIDILKDILNTYYGHRIKRYILGQTLTTEAEATGLGSGVADAHMDTFMQIVRFDALKLEETITWQFVEVIKNLNFPKSKHFKVRFRLDVEHEDVEKKLQAFQTAYSMGAAIRETDVMEMIGAAIPGPNDKVLQQSQQQQGGMPGMGGQPGSGGGVAPAASMTTQQFEQAFAKAGAGGSGVADGDDPNGDGSAPAGTPGGPVNPGDGGDRIPVGQYARSPAAGQRSIVWDESEHPRDDAGMFVDRSGHNRAAVDPHPEEGRGRDTGPAGLTKREAIIKAMDGSTRKVADYEQSCRATYLYTGTSPSEWKAVGISGVDEVDGPNGKVSMPVFEFPEGFAKAPSIFEADGSNSCCELCGHDIKKVYHIQHDGKKWTMAVGSECVTHFTEGKSGDKLAKEAKYQADRDFAGEAQSMIGKMRDWHRRVNFANGGDGVRSVGWAIKNEQARNAYRKLLKILGYDSTGYRTSKWLILDEAASKEAKGRGWREHGVTSDRTVSNWVKRHGDEAREAIDTLQDFLQGGGKLSETPAEHYARRSRKPSVHQKNLLGDDQHEFRWITIGGGPDGDGGEHHGGTHVKIDKKGNIVAGPAALAAKGIKNLHDFGTVDHPAKKPKKTVGKSSGKLGGEHQEGLFEPDEELHGQQRMEFGVDEPDSKTDENRREPIEADENRDDGADSQEKMPIVEFLKNTIDERGIIVDLEGNGRGGDWLIDQIGQYPEAEQREGIRWLREHGSPAAQRWQLGAFSHELRRATGHTPEDDWDMVDGKAVKPSQSKESEPEPVDSGEEPENTERPAERKFMTAGEAIKAGRSYADWTNEIGDAFVQGEIDEDHPAYQSIQPGNSAHTIDYNEARDVYGQQVRTFNGNVGKVVDVSDDGRSVTVEHPDGTRSLQTPVKLDHLGAWVKDRMERGRPIPDEVMGYLADTLAEEALANGENISKPIERMGIPVKEAIRGGLRSAVAEKFVEKMEAKQAAEPAANDAENPPSEARLRAMEKQRAAKEAEGADGEPAGDAEVGDGRVRMVQAKAGGETSDVDGKFYRGGQWMPVHGLSQKRPNKDDAGEGEGEAPVANENRQPTARKLSPEELADEQERREHQERWAAVQSGPLGKLLKLGKNQHNIRFSDSESYIDHAEEIGDDAFLRAIEVAKEIADQNNRKKYPDATEEDHEYAESEVESHAEQLGKSLPRRMSGKLKENPNALRARAWIDEALRGQSQPLDRLEKLHNALTGEPASDSESPDAAAATEAAAEEPAGLTRDNYNEHLWQKINEAWDRGETVNFPTMTRNVVGDPKYRDRFRFQNGEIQFPQGKSWVSVAGQTLDSLASQLGVPNRFDVPYSEEDQAEFDRQNSQRLADAGEEEAFAETYGQFVEKHYGGSFGKAADAREAAGYSDDQTAEWMATHGGDKEPAADDQSNLVTADKHPGNGSIVTDADGHEWLVMKARHGFVEGAPIENGKAIVNSQSIRQFYVGDNIAGKEKDELRTTGRNYYDEQEQGQQHQQPAEQPSKKGWDAVPDAARDYFESNVVNPLRDQVNRLDDIKNRAGIRYAWEHASNGGVGADDPHDGSESLASFVEAAKAEGYDGNNLAETHPEYPALLEKLRMYRQWGDETAGKKSAASEDAPATSNWSPETHLTIAADSIDKLRGQDVFRLLDSAPPEHMQAMADYIKKNRPELAGEVDEAHADVQDERGEGVGSVAPAAKQPKSPVPTTQAEAIRESSLRLGGGQVHVPATEDRVALLKSVMAAKGRAEVEALIGKDAADRWYKWRIGGSEPWTSLVNAMKWEKFDTQDAAERSLTGAQQAEESATAEGDDAGGVSDEALQRTLKASQAIANRPDGAAVNVPLSKRGNIDSDIDKFKERQAKDEKAARRTSAKQAAEDKAAAKELFAEHGDLAISHTLEQLGKTGDKAAEKEARKRLDSMIKWEPGKARKFLESIAEKAGGSAAVASDTPASTAETTAEESPVTDAAPAAQPEAPADDFALSPDSPVAPKPSRKRTAIVEDFGEKIGGARKEKAVPTGPRPKKDGDNQPKDDRPGWARRYRIAEDANNPGQYFVVDDRTKKMYGEGDDRSSQSSFSRQFEISLGRRPSGMKNFMDRKDAERAIEKIEAERNHGISIARDGKYAILRTVSDRKRPVVKGGFGSYEEAKQYLADNPREIIEHEFPQYETAQYLDDVRREGPKVHTGDVKPSDFQKTFNFRGGEFGNWNSGRDGQTSLNHAFHALHDLADVVGMPARAVALDGDLAIAFGARGTGGKNSARAHYEPEKRVINLTKMSGAGTLAHEWMHSLDHKIAQLAGLKKDHSAIAQSSPRDLRDLRPEIRDAVLNLRKAMTSKPVSEVADSGLAKKANSKSEQYLKMHFDNLEKDFQSTYRKVKPFTPSQQKEWDEAKAAIISGSPGDPKYIPGKGYGGRHSYDALEKMNELYKARTGRSFYTSSDNSTGRDVYWSIKRHMQTHDDLKKANEGQPETRHTSTDYMNDAHHLDSTRAGQYYTLPEEMMSRAFEAYVTDKLAEKDRRSDYLSGKADNRYYAHMGLKPFPEGEERTRINEAFDNLFKALKHESRTDERGEHVRLYSRGRSDEAQSSLTSAFQSAFDARS